MSPRVKIPGSRVLSPCIIRAPGIVMPPRRFLLPSSLKPPTSRGVLTSLSRHRLPVPGIARPRFAPEVTLVLPSGPGNVEIKLNSSQVNQLRSGLQGVKWVPGRRELIWVAYPDFTTVQMYVILLMLFKYVKVCEVKVCCYLTFYETR